MGSSLLDKALSLLPIIGPAVAALPEFKALYEGIADALDSDADQDTLKRALVLAEQGSGEAHTELQRLVAERS